MSVSETRIEHATGITNNDIVVLGGTHTNKLATEFLQRLAPHVKTHGEDRTARSFEIMGKPYKTEYSESGSHVEVDHGLIVRMRNLYSSDPARLATFLAGCHGLGTGGAAQVLVNEHLARQVLKRATDADSFIAVIRAREVGSDYVVDVEDVHSPINLPAQ
ncbi:hypothetical protein [Actinomycetospora succinea]|uniref:hypothetical protein n=1 Tax=Actinomycetospora succinea TaxID=663603 RepID=UPI00105CD234|nr:hypothetical protein [Actinomycetospora succinea]